MPTGISRTAGSTGIPIWQGGSKDTQIVQGGFQLVLTGLPVGAVIAAGTPLVYDEAARTATISGQGTTLQTAATGSPTAYRVPKNSPLKVGDPVTLTIGGNAVAISSIDTISGGTAYDVINVATTIGNAAVGAPIFVSNAAGAGAGAYNANINALLYDDAIVPAFGGISVSAVIRGTLYARRVPFIVPASLATIAGLKFIIFSQSK
jgi:hypothetical protein